MSKETNIDNKETELGKDLFNIFDGFVKKGTVVEEREVISGFKVKLKVLNVSELMEAESIINIDRAPSDIVAKVRGASILSQAILTLNGNDIEKENLTKEEIRTRRFILYKQLLTLPAIVIQKIYSFYIECVEKQEGYYSDFGKTVDEMQNF